jgi:hypothetical protein
MWSDEMVIILRNLIADVSSTPTYDDSRLQQLLLIAGQFNQQDVTFKQAYAINVVDATLTPDPTDVTTRDDAFINLALLKAACIIDNNEARLAAKRAVLMRDNTFTVDNRSVAESILQIWQKGWCQHFVDARYEFLAGNIGSAGGAVIGPFRVYAGYYGGPWTPDGNYAGGSVFGVGSDVLNDGRYR